MHSYITDHELEGTHKDHQIQFLSEWPIYKIMFWQSVSCNTKYLKEENIHVMKRKNWKTGEAFFFFPPVVWRRVLRKGDDGPSLIASFSVTAPVRERLGPGFGAQPCAGALAGLVQVQVCPEPSLPVLARPRCRLPAHPHPLAKQLSKHSISPGRACSQPGRARLLQQEAGLGAACLALGETQPRRCPSAGTLPRDSVSLRLSGSRELLSVCRAA